MPTFKIVKSKKLGAYPQHERVSLYERKLYIKLINPKAKFPIEIHVA